MTTKMTGRMLAALRAREVDSEAIEGLLEGARGLAANLSYVAGSVADIGEGGAHTVEWYGAPALGSAGDEFAAHRDGVGRLLAASLDVAVAAHRAMRDVRRLRESLRMRDGSTDRAYGLGVDAMRRRCAEALDALAARQSDAARMLQREADGDAPEGARYASRALMYDASARAMALAHARDVVLSLPQAEPVEDDPWAVVRDDIAAAPARDSVAEQARRLAERAAEAERRHAFLKSWYGERWEALRGLLKGSDLWPRACAIMANGAENGQPPTYAQQLSAATHAARRWEERARRAEKCLLDVARAAFGAHALDPESAAALQNEDIWSGQAPYAEALSGEVTALVKAAAGGAPRVPPEQKPFFDLRRRVGDLSDEAAHSLAEGRGREAAILYRAAAALELRALDAVPASKAKTRSLVAGSAEALASKARLADRRTSRFRRAPGW